MFDGNHRSTRRAVNLGTRQQRQQQQQQQQQQRGGGGGGIGRRVGVTPPKASLTVNNASVLLEESKRRRVERRIQQQQNQSATIVSKYYRGHRTRKIVLLRLEEQINSILCTTATTISTTSAFQSDSIRNENKRYNDIQIVTIRQLTIFLNLRYRLLLPIKQQQQQKHQPNYRNTLITGNSQQKSQILNHAIDQYLDKYVDYIIQVIRPFRNDDFSVGSTMLLSLLIETLPNPYMGHRIIRTLIETLALTTQYYSTSMLDPSTVTHLANDEKLVHTLAFVLGISKHKEDSHVNDGDIVMMSDLSNAVIKSDSSNMDGQLHRWKRLGDRTVFQLLLECYCNRLRQQQQQQQQPKNDRIMSSINTDLFETIQQLVPQSTTGHAFQVAIQLAAPSSSSLSFTVSKAVNSSSASFMNLVQPLVQILSPLPLPNRNDNDGAGPAPSELNGYQQPEKDDTKCSSNKDDDDLLITATKRMITESSIQLLLNAITLYRRDVLHSDDATRLRMTSLMVQLLQFIFCTPEISNSNVEKLSSTFLDIKNDQQQLRTLLTILVGRVVRGDSNLLTTGNPKTNNNNSIDVVDDNDMDDEDDNDDDDDDDDEGNTVTTSTISATTATAHSVVPSNTVRRKTRTPNEERIESSRFPFGSHHSPSSATRLVASPQDDRAIIATAQSGAPGNDVRRKTGVTRQDLLTTSKLDKIYKSCVQRHSHWFDEVCRRKQVQKQQQYYIHLLGIVANELCNADLLLQWGHILFTTKKVDDEQNSCKEIGQRAFVTILAILLQFTTGLHGRQSYASSLLSKLAFDQELTSMIWSNMLTQVQKDRRIIASDRSYTSSYLPSSTYLGFAVFCDLFSHTLISAKDDMFLRLYTNAAGNSFDDQRDNLTPVISGNPPGGFLASDVIVCLRELLYDVYWTKPVKVDDFECILPSTTMSMDGTSGNKNRQNDEACLHASRSRLFLSGTKLWNSLYERWNRLVIHRSGDGSDRRNDICDESAWWFPPMTGALSAGTSNPVASASSDVTQRRRTRRVGSNIRDHDMIDDDDDDEDDDMSVDTTDSDNDSNHSQTMGENDDVAAVEAESDALAETFSDPKLARILTCIPQSVSFEKRVKLFDSLLRIDKRKSQHDEEGHIQQALLAMMRGDEDGDFGTTGRVRLDIRRDHLYEDSMEQLNSLGSSKALKKRVQVSFINQHGTAEAGIDGGGVFKEFIDDLIKDAFTVSNTSPSESTKPSLVTATHQLFTVTPLQALRINSDLFEGKSDHDSELLPHYEFLGRVLGKAVYESILVDPQFCLPFLNQLLGKNNSVEDLKNYDPEYYRNLTKLLQLSSAEIEDLGLCFEITFGSASLENANVFDQSTRTVELFPGGSRVPVTKDNVIQYIHLIAHRRLNVETAQATKAFLRGFRDLIPVSWVRLFSAYELQRLISGDDSVKGIDVDSFRTSMQYAAGYHPSQPVITWFWEIVEEMTADQQHKLLKFMTSCSRQPLLGFRSLEPAPCIQQIRLPDEFFLSDNIDLVAKKAPLPTASTCMNLLKLPNYRSKEIMRQKIVAAIEAGAGFELT